MNNGSSDDSSNSSSSEVDSDNEIDWKRKRMTLPDEPTPMTIDEHKPQEAEFKTAASAYVEKKKKVNNIWGQVIQEEHMSDLMKGVDVDDSINCIGLNDRGIETYPIAHIMPRKRGNRGALTYSPSKSDEERDREKAKDRGKKFKIEDSELSSGGFSDESKAYFRRDRKFNPSRPALTLNTKNEKQFRVQKKMREAMSTKLNEFNDVDLANYISSKLKEEKKDLLHRTVQFMGREVAIKLFKKTMKIEARGGILVKHQERRRTPGGVFFYLLRGYKTFPVEKVDKVFELEKKTMSDEAKKKKQAKTYARKKKMKELAKKIANQEEGEIQDSD